LPRLVSDFFVDLPFVDKAPKTSFKTASNEGKSLGGTDFICTVLLAAVEKKGLKFQFIFIYVHFLKAFCYIESIK